MVHKAVQSLQLSTSMVLYLFFSILKYVPLKTLLYPGTPGKFHTFFFTLYKTITPSLNHFPTSSVTFRHMPSLLRSYSPGPYLFYVTGYFNCTCWLLTFPTVPCPHGQGPCTLYISRTRHRLRHTYSSYSELLAIHSLIIHESYSMFQRLWQVVKTAVKNADKSLFLWSLYSNDLI